MAESLIGKRVNVLDKGWIELVDLMPHPDSDVTGDLAIVNAARVSFLGESKGPERDKKLLFYLLRHRHTSPFRDGGIQVSRARPAGDLVAMGAASHLEYERPIRPLHALSRERLLCARTLAQTKRGQ